MNRNEVLRNTYLEYQPNLGLGENFSLKIREQAGLDIWTSDYATIREMGSTSSLKGGDIENYGSQHNVFNNLFTVNFDGKFGKSDEWRLNVILGNEFNHESIRNWDYYGSNFNFPGFTNIGNATSLTSSEYKRQERTVGFFGSLSMSWQDQVYLTVTGRNDWDSKLAFSKQKSFFYPSVGLSALLSEMVKLPEVISYAKIRGSYTVVASFFDRFLTNPGYEYNSQTHNWANPTVYPMDNMKPEKTKSWEIGLNLKFWGNRFNLDATYYRSNTLNQTFKVDIPSSSGYKQAIVQAGNVTKIRVLN